MSRKERLRVIRARLAELLEDGTLAACGGYELGEGVSVSVAGHVGTLLELAIRLERGPVEVVLGCPCAACPDAKESVVAVLVEANACEPARPQTDDTEDSALAGLWLRAPAATAARRR